MRDIIFVSLENWDQIWRRNQFLCAGLARRFPQSKILFVNPSRHVFHHVRRRQIASLKGPKTWIVPELPNVTVTRPLKWLPDSAPGATLFNEAMLRHYIRRDAQRLGIQKPILWLNPHDAVHMVGHMGEQSVIYDITDDWALASCSPQQKQAIEDADRRLCRKADLVVVCSEALLQSRRALSQKILLLPNGVDVAHYHDVKVPSKAAATWPSPVFGYTGTLHSDRVDSQLVLSLAQAFPSGSVVLVGPGRLSAEDRLKLQNQKNVFMPGAVPYAEIPSVMRQFDVCIVPHQESEFTESLNPIKLWEYLAAGKPIVSTNVAGFRRYSHLCHIASGAPAFIKACQTALQEGAEKVEARQAEAACHSWESRIDDLLAVLQTSNLT
jgi:teichuronic acid biosynthesis glycosyltransferase TuaH